MILVISGCTEEENKKNSNAYNMRDWCTSNINEIGCEQLLKCDVSCNDLPLNTHIRTCHSLYTNQIIARCNSND